MILAKIKNFFSKKRKKSVEVPVLALPLVPPIRVSSYNVIDYVILDNEEIIFHTQKPLTSIEEEQRAQEAIVQFLKENSKIKIITMIKEKGVLIDDE